MILTELQVTHVRLLSDVSIEPHLRLNLIYGANGSGKSSLLEAIQCLSVGHSFRTRKVRELISHEQDRYRVIGVLTDPRDARVHRAGIERCRDGTTSIRLDQEDVSSLALLTALIPLKVLTPDSHDLIQRGPDGRRQFLDWGVFHVKPDFLQAWRTFRRSLLQRNELLRNLAAAKEIDVWNDSLLQSAQQVNDLRLAYLEELSATLDSRLDAMKVMFHVKLRYRQGWSDGETLAQVMERNADYHRRMKTTTDGPHRADIQISVSDMPAKQILSRGEQKLLVYALHLAQLDILQQRSGQQAIVCCDDLLSELDPANSTKLIEQLMLLKAQLFVSGVDLQPLRDIDHKGFHVERGVVNT